MLSELSIDRFKTVREETLEFGRVNLFIGGNGTGKSNLLEAIGLASACLGRGLGDSDIGRKGLRISPPELMKSSFKNEDLPKTLALEAKFSTSVEYKATLQSREGDPLLRFFSESASFLGKKYLDEVIVGQALQVSLTLIGLNSIAAFGTKLKLPTKSTLLLQKNFNNFLDM